MKNHYDRDCSPENLFLEALDVELERVVLAGLFSWEGGLMAYSREKRRRLSVAK